MLPKFSRWWSKPLKRQLLLNSPSINLNCRQCLFQQHFVKDLINSNLHHFNSVIMQDWEYFANYIIQLYLHAKGTLRVLTALTARFKLRHWTVEGKLVILKTTKQKTDTKGFVSITTSHALLFFQKCKLRWSPFKTMAFNLTFQSPFKDSDYRRKKVISCN